MGESSFLWRTCVRSRAAAQKWFSAANATVPVSYFCTEAADSMDKLEKRKNKLFALPPYTCAADAGFIGKEITGHGRTGKITATTATTTALKWVLHCCPNVPRSLIHKLFRLRHVRRETSALTSSCIDVQPQLHQLRRVSAKDAIDSGDRIFLPITVQDVTLAKHDYCCTEDDINYVRSLELYKDSAIIVVNKPPGMPVQGGTGIRISLDTLAATALRYDYSEYPRLVHRLDRDCSGVLVMGRTQTSATVLHSIFRDKTFGAPFDDIENTKRILTKRYWALVIGTPKRARGIISAPLTKVVLDNGKAKQIVIAEDSGSISSQHAITEYQVIGSSIHGYTWLQLCPITGRKHQLRVHCAEALGTPIVGDYKYGWHAHRKWRPMHSLRSNREHDKNSKQTFPLGLDLERGSISEKKPHLHLHCRQMILPDVSLALQHLQSPPPHHDILKLEKLSVFAPLPSHMQRSWDILSSTSVS